MQTVRITTSQNIDIDYDIASVGDRVLGRLIDMGIFILLFLVPIIIMSIMSGGKKSSEIALGLTVIIGLVLYVFYDLICEIFFNGQSIGKRVMKVKVISLDGGRPTVGQYLLRWLFRIVDFSLTGGLCGLICTATTQKVQRLGDIVAGTTLVKTSRRTNIDNVAFNPVYEGYNPIFPQVTQLKDKDIATIHEVIESYRKSGNAVIVYNTAQHVSKLLAVTIPQGMNDMLFLQTLINDYNHLTAMAAAAELG